MKKRIESERFYRTAELTRVSSADTRTVELSWASTKPYERWFGWETLSMDPKHVRLDRIKTRLETFLDIIA